MVSRLNESSRRKQLHLLKAQHKQIADQLSGLTFVPQISERSRELAAMNKTLPERVAALMRKKKKKLDTIRDEKAAKELAQATFHPQLNKRKDEDPGRRIGHLLQYEIDRRVRAEQRKALIEEMESKALTFTPTINKNSSRIVERIQRENAERAAASAGERPSSPSGLAATATSVSASQSKAAMDRRRLEDILLNRAPKGVGRSHLPGHEEETFAPVINARSRALPSDKVVYARLYDSRKRAEAEAEEKVRAAHRRDEELLPSSLSHTTSGAAHPVGTGGEPAPGHPQYFSPVPWTAGAHDFILRRLLTTPL